MPGKTVTFGGCKSPEFWDNLWKEQIIGIARIKAKVKPRPVTRIKFKTKDKWE